MIRVAQNKDIPALLKLGASLHHESPNYKKRPFDHTVTANFFQGLIAGGGVIFLYEKDNQIVGGFVGGCVKDWQGGSLMTFDYVIFVHPDYRQGRIAIDLVMTFIDWSKLIGAKYMQCGVATGINDEAVARLYEGFGFKETGRFFELELT